MQLTQPKPGDNFLWHSGLYDDNVRPTLERMRESSTPMGLVLPVNQGGVLKTIQMSINAASMNVFGFNAMSVEDMFEALMRDTSGDWYGADLEVKKQKYQQEGTKWEQLARIKDKTGQYFLMRFQCERLGYGDYVLSWGTKESECVPEPELLLV